MPPESLLLFSRQLYALANVRNINYEHSYTWPGRTLRWLPFEQQSNPRLADSIALLPLTESASDVTAVALEYRPKEIIVYYSKNRPLMPHERD